MAKHQAETKLNDKPSGDRLQNLIFTDATGGMTDELTETTLRELRAQVPFLAEHLAHTEVLSTGIEIVLKRRGKDQYIHVHVADDEMGGEFEYYLNKLMDAQVHPKILPLRRKRAYVPTKS